MKEYGLIGLQLNHSFSKKYFEEKFLKENLAHHRFYNFEINNINQLHNLLKINNKLIGLAVTIPYKQQVLPLLNYTSNEVKELNACNCIKIKNNLLYGYNTDFIGFEKSFIPFFYPNHKKALVLGNGGASKAVQFVLNKNNIPYLIVSRKPDESEKIISYSGISQTILKEFTALINTTSVGTYPFLNECVDLPYQLLGKNHFLYDLVYNPTITKFLYLGKQKGATIQNGYNMLTIQAEENWRIWNSD